MPLPPPLPAVVVYQDLELAPPPVDFSVAEDADGSLVYRAGSSLRAELGKARLSVLAVRHGQAESNARSEQLGQPLLYGQSESPLTPKGHQQARFCAGEILHELGGTTWLLNALDRPELLPVLAASDLARAQETAQEIKDGLADEAEKLAGSWGRRFIEQNLQVVRESRLRETHFGDFEGRPLSELVEAYPEFVSHWRPSEGLGTDFRHRFPGGESRADVMRRVGQFFHEACQVYAGRTLVVVSHGETLLSTRALLGQARVVKGKVAAETGAIPNAHPFWLWVPGMQE
jgi:broad specificity phosphatase PhoE